MEQHQQLGNLLKQMSDLRGRNEALQRKVEYLENLLNERFEETKISYQAMKPYFDSQKKQIMELFFENFPQRLSHQDVIDQFSAKHPAISTANINRRVRELCQNGRLVSDYDQGRELTVFFLKLLPDDRKNQHAETTSQKSPDGQKRLGELV